MNLMPPSYSQPYSIDRELRADERAIWKGRPATGIRLRGSDAFFIPFSLFWCGFAIAWETMAITQVPKSEMAGYIFPLFGIPFVVMGLYLVFGRFIHDAKSRERTEYAITDQRVIISSGLFSKEIKSLNLNAMPEISFTEKPDGTGTITFGERASPFGARGLRVPGMNQDQTPAFDMISDVRKVYEIIQKAQRNELS